MLIYKNILRTYIKPFFFSILFCSFLFVIGELLPVIEKVQANKVSLSIVLIYFKYYMPFIIVNYILPLASLISIFIAIAIMTKNKELVIYRAIGMSPYQIFLPIIIVVILITLFCLALMYSRIPDMVLKSNNIWKYEIKKISMPEEKYENITIYLSSTYFLTAKKYLWQTNEFENVSLIKTKNFIDFDLRYDAEKLKYMNNQWYLINGKLRLFKSETFKDLSNNNINSQTIYKIENFAVKPVTIIEQPAELLNLLKTDKKKQDEIKMSELLELIEMKKKVRLDYRKDKVYLYNKIAGVVKNISLTAIGLPIALKTSNVSISLGFGLSLVISFIYWILSAIISSLGETGLLYPEIASFLIDFLFITLGAYFFIRIKNKFY